MIRSFLDRGDELRELDAAQKRALDEQFLLYLVHGTSFRDALRESAELLTEYQFFLKEVIKAKLTTMIEDPVCNTRIKPAVLRLAAGDTTGFRVMQENPRRTRRIVSKNAKTFRRLLREVKFDEIGPTSIASLEEEYLESVRPHARNFVNYRAVFLTSAEHGLSTKDMITDLMIIALRTFRWYYPYREGLHMLNTMRAAITNRGNSLIKYNTADVRRRLIMLDSGEMYNRESSGDYEAALNSSAGSADPTRWSNLRLDIDRLREYGYNPSVIEFVSSPEMQDRFVGWVGAKYGVRLSSIEDVGRYLKSNGKSYKKVVALFLQQPAKSVNTALNALRSVAA